VYVCVHVCVKVCLCTVRACVVLHLHASALHAHLRADLRTRRAQAVDFSADAQKLLTGCNDKVIRLWDVESADEAVVTLKGHTGSLKKAMFFTDQQTCVSGGDDKTIR
jgi:WD40 repeat protein